MLGGGEQRAGGDQDDPRDDPEHRQQQHEDVRPLGERHARVQLRPVGAGRRRRQVLDPVVGGEVPQQGDHGEDAGEVAPPALHQGAGGHVADHGGAAGAAERSRLLQEPHDDDDALVAADGRLDGREAAAEPAHRTAVRGVAGRCGVAPGLRRVRVAPAGPGRARRSRVRPAAVRPGSRSRPGPARPPAAGPVRRRTGCRWRTGWHRRRAAASRTASGAERTRGSPGENQVADGQDFLTGGTPASGPRQST